MLRLLEAFRVRVLNVALQDCAAYLIEPDEEGWYSLRIRANLAGDERRFFTLHDLAHVIAGEADESTWEDFDDPYPHFERRADLFAALGVLHARERAGPPEFIEAVLWRRIPSGARSWKYRVPEIARALAGMVATDEQEVDEWADY